VLAGGTDLIVQLKMERLAPEFLIDINRISELDGIAVQNGLAHVGARTSIREIANDPVLIVNYPALVEACASFSTIQVQVMGTIGGNLCNGSPASDVAPALIAFDAQAAIAGPNGDRSLPIDDFFLGPGKTALQSDELLKSITLPSPQPSTGSVFLKVARVAADIAKVNVAVTLVRAKDNRISDCRVVFGSVAPTPLRAREAEALLKGKTFSPEAVADAAEVASREVSPIDDVRSTVWYRREISRVLAHDALHQAWKRAQRQKETVQRDQFQVTRRASATPASGSVATPVRARTAQDPVTKQEIELTVNGEKHSVWVASNDLLLNVLRDDLELIGAKYGCGIGECGACTVQMDGKPVLSCLVLAVSADGSDILTVEGLRQPNGELDPLQDAFVELQAFQCGYCTPGILMMSKSLLKQNKNPTEAEVREYLKGNLCRCTGYARIVQAVMSAADVEAKHERAVSVPL
jgi:xanthine dehydrogenase iron-sulfur cluster and FAD-binding subunit A